VITLKTINEKTMDKNLIEEIHNYICGVYAVDQRLIDEFKDDIVSHFCPEPDENLCIICGKPTNGIDYDYLVHDWLHLGCQLSTAQGCQLQK